MKNIQVKNYNKILNVIGAIVYFEWYKIILGEKRKNERAKEI